MNHYDAVVLGCGHNGLVTLALLAARGLKVLDLEMKNQIGGAAVTEQPFQEAEGQKVSRASYLLGPMPTQIERAVGIRVPRIKRDPWYFVPGLDGRYLLSSSNSSEMRRLFAQFFSERDWLAYSALDSLIADIRRHLLPAWLEAPLSLDDTAQRYLPSGNLRRQFLQLCRLPIGEWLMQFDWDSPTLPVMFATTDGFTGAYGSWNTPGTGYNFLAHNMVPGDGIWSIVKGGMGTVTRMIAERALANQAEIKTGIKAVQIYQQGGITKGVVLDSGETIYAPIVVCGCDPFRIRSMVDAGRLPDWFNKKLAEYARYPGSSGKLNLVLREHPTFSCLGTDLGQFRTTTHILPAVPNLIETLVTSFEQARSGRIPDWPLIELMFHTQLDPSMRGAAGYQTAGIFTQWLPWDPFADPNPSVRAENEKQLISRLCEICELYAPGFSKLIVAHDLLTPFKIQELFGITGGHICHIDHRFMFEDRVPVEYPGFDGLLVGGASAHPGGCVSGCPGFIAANTALDLLGISRYEPDFTD